MSINKKELKEKFEYFMLNNEIISKNENNYQFDNLEEEFYKEYPRILMEFCDLMDYDIDYTRNFYPVFKDDKEDNIFYDMLREFDDEHSENNFGKAYFKDMILQILINEME